MTRQVETAVALALLRAQEQRERSLFDATLLVVDVTDEDIEEGRFKDGLHCPVALALTRATAICGLRWWTCPEFVCAVGPQQVRDDRALQRAVWRAERFRFPAAVRQWILDWDRTRDRRMAPPATFTLSLGAYTVRQLAQMTGCDVERTEAGNGK